MIPQIKGEGVNSYTSVSPRTQVQLLINQPFRQQLTKQLVDQLFSEKPTLFSVTQQ